MTDLELAVVREEAQAARAWIERMQRQIDLIHKDMCGGCALASAYLLRRLQSRQIPARIVVGDGHSFIRAGEYYVDVTATQFGYEPVYIATQPPDSIPPWYEEMSTEKLDELLVYFEENGWGWDCDQITRHVLEAS